MSFIDTLKALFGFSTTQETVENIVVPTTSVVEAPVVTTEPVTQTPIEESPEEKIVASEPVMSTDNTVTEAPVETSTTTENQ